MSNVVSENAELLSQANSTVDKLNVEVRWREELEVKLAAAEAALAEIDGQYGWLLDDCQLTRADVIKAIHDAAEPTPDVCIHGLPSCIKCMDAKDTTK